MNNKIKKEDKEKLEDIFDEATNNYRYDWGIKEFNKILKKYSDIEDDKVLCRLGLLYDHLAMKKEDKKQKELQDKAIELYKKALEINPESHKAMWGIGRVYWHMESEKAIPYAKKAQKLAIKAGKDEALYTQNVGLVYEFLEEFDKAEKWLLKGKDMKPDSWSPYLNLVTFYRLTKDFEKSKKYAKELERLFKKEKEEFKNASWGKRIQKVIKNADKPLS